MADASLRTSETPHVRSGRADTSRGLIQAVEAPLLQTALALGLSIIAGLLRVALGAIDPHVIAAGLYFPAIVAASLLGGWRCGSIAMALCVCAEVGVFGASLAGHAARRPVNFVLFLGLSGGAVGICHWVGSLVVRLQASRERLALRNLNYDILFDTINEGFAVCEAIRDASGRMIDYRVLEMNPALRAFLRLGPNRVGGRMSDAPGDFSDWYALCDRVLATGRPASFEQFYPHDQRWREIRVSRITSDVMAQFFIDITDRKTEEARQRALFDELNHRVKNNLAIVSGMLGMQARTATGDGADALRKAMARVHSIADLHASLYKAHRTGDVDLGAYLNELGVNLGLSLLEPDSPLHIVVETAPVIVSTDHAVPLGLVVSELVTNAVKHAFAPGQRGEIRIQLEREAAGARLRVCDDGRGLPDAPGQGLGGNLVRSLVGQIGAELSVGSDPGLTFDIALPPEAVR